MKESTSEENRNATWENKVNEQDGWSEVAKVRSEVGRNKKCNVKEKSKWNTNDNGSQNKEERQDKLREWNEVDERREEDETNDSTVEKTRNAK